MLWLESVIGTVLWCWWQVPARRLQRRVGALSSLVTRYHYDIKVFREPSTRETTQEKGPATNR
jgi:hypothetical protein